MKLNASVAIGLEFKHKRLPPVADVHSRITCDATITDVSTRGMRLLATKQFPIGSTIIVEWGKGFVPCTVRHFSATTEGWVLGVEAECLPGVVRLMSELKG